jgi:hypothetical protein
MRTFQILQIVILTMVLDKCFVFLFKILTMSKKLLVILTLTLSQFLFAQEWEELGPKFDNWFSESQVIDFDMANDVTMFLI